ncbi:GMC oxidoreductase [Dothidotthia symphoricarpi CBS 119687]|uniref:GMC oxidoreductase n=1 Tax=Dothidotthia symphoricarpi CBS 119687 TaxID=1392245 RepID=A0A6A6AP03_9PLEO|nr:GMC oxidoreductase [Dothidotthia symphoricarpi CBS 119687]KAF2133649.1 GMC oxidoreductase [Dothidotthia symphoricarpi CBS 119687]
MTSLLTLLFLFGLRLSEARVLPRYSSRISARAANSTNYDFVIVGGGISGLVLADRLTEDSHVTVLVIEAGPFDKGEDEVLVPGSWNPAQYLWPGLVTEPLTALNNRSEPIVVAKVVGGGSTINAMNLLRGTKADFAGWVSLGNDGWGWDDMLPYFKKSENFTAPDASFAATSNISWDDSVRGHDGPVQYSYPNYAYPGLGHWWTAALSAGMTPVQDPSSGVNPGIFWTPTVLDTSTQTRCDARVAHYDRVISTRPNYHVLAENMVSRILFEGTQATGVEYFPSAGGNTSTVFAMKEVILAAGALHTPQILQLSGVGPKSVLDSLSIPVVANLPGVGTNLQDHGAVAVQYNFTKIITPNAISLVTNSTYSAEQWEHYKNHEPSAFTVVRGLGTTFGTLALQDMTTSNSSIIADAMADHAASSLPTDTDPTVIAGYQAQRRILIEQLQNPNMAVSVLSWDTYSSVTVSHVKPFSRGKITIRSTDILVEPKIDYRTATDPTDLTVVVATLRKLRELMSAPAMVALGTVEAAPLGANIKSEEDFTAVLRASYGVSAAHQCCTAPMMPLGLGGVVDLEHKVYGVTGLRVVDVSTFPMAVSGGPTANVYAVAEKLADVIKKEFKEI